MPFTATRSLAMSKSVNLIDELPALITRIFLAEPCAILWTFSSGYRRLLHTSMNFLKLRSYVFSASAGKQHPGSSLFAR